MRKTIQFSISLQLCSISWCFAKNLLMHCMRPLPLHLLWRLSRQITKRFPFFPPPQLFSLFPTHFPHSFLPGLSQVAFQTMPKIYHPGQFYEWEVKSWWSNGESGRSDWDQNGNHIWTGRGEWQSGMSIHILLTMKVSSSADTTWCDLLCWFQLYPCSASAVTLPALQ